MRNSLLIVLSAAVFGSVASAQTSTDGQAQSPAVQVSAQGASEQTAPAQAAPVKKKAKHVYTSDDMKAADPNDVSSASSSSGGGAAGSSVAGATDPKDDKSGKPKKAAKKVDAAALAAQQAKVDDLKSEVSGETNVIADIQRLIAEQPSRASAMGPGLTKQQSDLSDLQKKLADAQAQLDAMKTGK